MNILVEKNRAQNLRPGGGLLVVIWDRPNNGLPKYLVKLASNTVGHNKAFTTVKTVANVWPRRGLLTQGYAVKAVLVDSRLCCD